MAATAPLLPGAPKVDKSDYQGFGPTIKKVAAYIRECGDDSTFQQFANAILDKCYPRSRHTTVLERAQCLLDYCNKNIRFAADPPQSEVVKSPRLTLCVDGAVACIPIEDCDGQATAYLSLCRAVGIDVQLLLQELRASDGGTEHHLAGAIRLDNGDWVKVDPSLKGNSRVGQVQPAVREEMIDPLDPAVTGAAGGPKFVAIGAKPRSRVVFEPVRSAMVRPMFDAFGRPV